MANLQISDLSNFSIFDVPMLEVFNGTVFSSTSTEIVVDASMARSAVIKGSGFSNPDVSGLAQNGTVTEYNLILTANSQPLFTFTGFSMSMSTFRSYLMNDDPIGFLQDALSEDDIISGSNNGNDNLAAYNGHDQIFAGAGDDTLDGGLGADVLIGGIGPIQPCTAWLVASQ